MSNTHRGRLALAGALWIGGVACDSPAAGLDAGPVTADATRDARDAATDAGSDAGTDADAGTDGGRPTTAGLRVPPEARACEVVLRQAEGGLAPVAWPDGVVGRVLSRPPHHALAFAARADAPLPTIPLQAEGDLALHRARCFDAAGAEGPGPVLDPL